MIFRGKLKGFSLVGSLRKILVSRLFSELFTARQYSEANVDSSPSATAETLVESISGDAGQQVVRSFLDNVEKIAEPGEFRAYSTADGSTVSAFIFVRKDGKVYLGGDSDAGLVKVVELTTALNKLVTELNAHLHQSGGSGIPTVAFSPFVQSEYESTTVVQGDNTLEAE